MLEIVNRTAGEAFDCTTVRLYDRSTVRLIDCSKKHFVYCCRLLIDMFIAYFSSFNRDEAFSSISIKSGYTRIPWAMDAKFVVSKGEAFRAVLIILLIACSSSFES